MPILRASEWISLLAFSGFVVLAWRRLAPAPAGDSADHLFEQH
jgi:hypothetical protein